MTTKSKAAMMSEAALELRVAARRAGQITDKMAWDVIATLQSRWYAAGFTLIPLNARAVVRKAQRELSINGESYPYVPHN